MATSHPSTDMPTRDLFPLRQTLQRAAQRWPDASRSIETIVSIVAAVESGLAYVPLDLGYPTDRLQAMLDDAQVRAVVGEPEALSTLQSRLDALPSLASPRPAGPLPHAADGDPVYVLFTSGSTG